MRQLSCSLLTAGKALYQSWYFHLCGISPGGSSSLANRSIPVILISVIVISPAAVTILSQAFKSTILYIKTSAKWSFILNNHSL